MSAIAAVIQPNAVHILADGAFYNPETGLVTDLECKVRKIPNVPAAYSSRGAAIAFPLFDQICEASQFRKFDEVVAVLPALLDLHDAYLKLFGKEGSEIVVVGWSESRNRGEIYARQSHSDNDALVRGECYKWTEGRVSFGVDWQNIPGSEEFEAIKVVPEFQRCRETLTDLNCGERDVANMGHSIGGGVYHCAITKDGAGKIAAVHEWPEDKVGERIRPLMIAAPDGYCRGYRVPYDPDAKPASLLMDVPVYDPRNDNFEEFTNRQAA